MGLDYTDEIWVRKLQEHAAELEQRVKALEAERETYRRALSDISTSLVVIEKISNPAIKLTIKEIKGWAREALK